MLSGPSWRYHQYLCILGRYGGIEIVLLLLLLLLVDKLVGFIMLC